MEHQGRRSHSVYSVSQLPKFPADQASGCRVETQGGTVYWLSDLDDEGFRCIVRERPSDQTTETMVLQGALDLHAPPELNDKFRGRLRADVEVGVSLALEVFGSGSRVLSETVVRIEEQAIPLEFFGGESTD